MKTTKTKILIIFAAFYSLASCQPKDDLQFEYNGSTINLPEEIDCASDGDTLIVYKADHGKIMIGYQRRFSEAVKYGILKEINDRLPEAPQPHNILLTVKSVLMARGIDDAVTVRQFVSLTYENLD